MHDNWHWQEIADALRVILPVILSTIALGRAERAHAKAKQVEAACTYPACGRIFPIHGTSKEDK